MKFPFQQFFRFTLSEQQGIVVLALLILLGFSLPTIYSKLHTPTTTDFSHLAEQAARLERSKTIQPTFTSKEKILSQEKSFFPFNPNTISKEKLETLPVPKRIMNNILKYRENGGAFRQAKDFKKIYGLSDSLYQKILPFLKIAPQKNTPKINKAPHIDTATFKRQVFNFDPNTIGKEELMQLGFSKKTSHIIINFRNKGGTFRQAKDLAKIYGIDKNLLSQLAPYIQIESPKKTITPKLESKKELVKVDINKSNAEDWQKLKGVGPYWAGRIVKFREALGGFNSTDQISETYNLPDSLFQQIKPYLESSSVYRKINFNEASAEDLAKHPYISRKLAKVMINFRNKQGPIQSIEELTNLKALSNSQIEKLTPYLEF